MVIIQSEPFTVRDLYDRADGGRSVVASRQRFPLRLRSVAAARSAPSRRLRRSGVSKVSTCFTRVCVQLYGLQAARASAQPHPLLLAHVGAHKESLQLAFALHVDEPPAVARVAQLRQHTRGFLRHLDAGTDIYI